MSAWIIWGAGPARDPLVREADTAELRDWPAEAVELAARRDDAWCVSVDAEEHDVESATYADEAIVGWAAA